MNNYVYLTSLFLTVAFTSISSKDINSKWVSSWRAGRESMKNQPNVSQAQLTGGNPSKESENRTLNESFEKIENDRASSDILCFVTTAYSADIELCSGSCFTLKLKHIDVAGCSRTKHPTWVVVNRDFVWSYCNTPLCNALEKLDVGGITSTDSNIKTNVRSVTECAMLCRGSSGCGVIEFEPQFKTCTLQSWPRITYSSGAAGDAKKIWMTGDVKVFFATLSGGGDMTYGQAEELCSNLGARVPNPQEMYDALDAGLNVCRCAWTQGGIIRLVITEPDPGCPNTSGQNGVVSCKWISMAADTFCTFN